MLFKKNIVLLALLSLLAASSSAMEQYLDITPQTSSAHIIQALQNMGRYDLEEYIRENNFAVDSSIVNLFASPSEILLPFNSTLLDKARKHPQLRIAPQPELRSRGQDDAMGLFAGEAIAKGQPIIEYAGQTKVIFTLAAEEPKIVSWLPASLSEQEIRPSDYVFGFQGKGLSRELWNQANKIASSSEDKVFVDVCIDPVKRGNAGRFANHSAMWANARMIQVVEVIDGKAYFHPLLVALRDIEPGEEILWDYGVDKGHIELRGKQLSFFYHVKAQGNLIATVNAPKPASDNDQCFKQLQEARYFYDNLTQREAQAMLIKPASYLLRREGSNVYFCVLAWNEELDEHDQLVVDLEYIEMKLWIIDGQFTFGPKSNPCSHPRYFTRLKELKKEAKYFLPEYLMMSKARPIRRS